MMSVVCTSPKVEDDEHKAPAGQPRSWGLCFALRSLSYVNDAASAIIEDAVGADPPDRERRVDRRTACLHQANAFREKAIADPEHNDQWVDEAINWLEQAMEAGRRAVVTVQAGEIPAVPQPAHEAAADTFASQQRLITRQ
jgi:hypothetical protein